MNERQERRTIGGIFDLGLIIKVVASTFEIVGGIAVLVVPRTFIAHVADFVTEGELTRDPDDFVANSIRETAHAFAVHSHYVLAAYLLIRGALKVGIIGLILKGKRYAYVLFMIMLALFATYETYRAIHTHAWVLGAAAIFDTGLLLLTAYVYKKEITP